MRLALLYVLVFISVLFSIVITSLGEELGFLLLIYLLVNFALVKFCPFFLFLLVSGLAAACECGIPWTFLLTLVITVSKYIKVNMSTQ